MEAADSGVGTESAVLVVELTSFSELAAVTESFLNLDAWLTGLDETTFLDSAAISSPDDRVLTAEDAGTFLDAVAALRYSRRRLYNAKDSSLIRRGVNTVPTVRRRL